MARMARWVLAGLAALGVAGCVPEAAPGPGTMTMQFRGETHVARLEAGCSGVCIPALGWHGEERGAYFMASARNPGERENLALSVGWDGPFVPSATPRGIVAIDELTDYGVDPTEDYEGIGPLAAWDLDLGAPLPGVTGMDGFLVVEGRVAFRARLCRQEKAPDGRFVDDPSDCDEVTGRYEGAVQVAPQNRAAAGL